MSWLQFILLIVVIWLVGVAIERAISRLASSLQSRDLDDSKLASIEASVQEIASNSSLLWDQVHTLRRKLAPTQEEEKADELLDNADALLEVFDRLEKRKMDKPRDG